MRRGRLHRTFGLLCPLIVAAAVIGCGYGFDPYRAQGVAQRVALQPLINNSFEPAVDELMADALQRTFLRRRAFELVEAGEAEYVLTGEIAPLTTRSQSFSSVNLALEYELTLELLLRVEHGESEPLEFDRQSLRVSEFYLASADVEVLRKNRREALLRLSDVMAERVHDLLREQLRP